MSSCGCPDDYHMADCPIITDRHDDASDPYEYDMPFDATDDDEYDNEDSVGNRLDSNYCRHGNYIGTPCGADYMCGQCEMGDD